MYEVFDQRSAVTIFTTRFRLVARIASFFIYGSDYAKEGEGWLDPVNVRRLRS